MNSPEASLAGVDAPSTTVFTSSNNEPHSHAPDPVHRAQYIGRVRAGSISSLESQSSDDGIEWEISGDYSAGNDFDPTGDGYDTDEEVMDDEYGSEAEEDTQHLLATSSNTRRGGMGMGMRVGETGTGTTIGLDFENDLHPYTEDYDTLPLTAQDGAHMNGVQMRRKYPTDEGRPRRGRKSKTRSQRPSHRGAPMPELGTIQTDQERLIAKRQLKTKMLWNVFYVFAWYGTSTSLSFYNKWLFSPNHHNFRFPLFTTCLHMLAQFLLSSLTLVLVPSLRPQSAPSVKDLSTKIMPCAVASGLDVGLSNSSLKSITLAFYSKFSSDQALQQTSGISLNMDLNNKRPACIMLIASIAMCKSSSLAFVLLFAFAFKLERPTWTLAGVIGVICVGLFMMVMSEVDFVLIGFIQVMLASVLGGLRWSLTQLLLERSNTKTGSLANPISTIFFLSPIMGICLCIVAGIFEGFGNIFRSEFFQTIGSSLGTLGLLFLGGIFAFAMVLAEFNLIARTSVVSLSVLGIIKEVVTIVVSSLVFHDQLTLVNILGLFITLTGIGFYHFMKLREMKAKSTRVAKEIADLNRASAMNSGDGGTDRISARRLSGRRGTERFMNSKNGTRFEQDVFLLEDEQDAEEIGMIEEERRDNFEDVDSTAGTADALPKDSDSLTRMPLE
ncbi:Triose-phosphate Transporter [Mortierella alpina]|nr:Triose-phosphate Transporter [Mortierella alpina]